MKKLSCQITSTFWLMGTSWEADSLKSNTLYRSDEVGLSVSQERISFTAVSESLGSCLLPWFLGCFFFFFMSALASRFSENILVLSAGLDCCLL